MRKNQPTTTVETHKQEIQNLREGKKKTRFHEQKVVNRDDHQTAHRPSLWEWGEKLESM